jgi:hypothetical protein
VSAPRALITGISGQDGSYLAELLLGKAYDVFGVVRGSPHASFPNLDAIRGDVQLLQGDLLDQMTLLDAITRSEPDELYNLAATSFVPASWRQPVMTAQFTAVGVTSMLEAVRITNPQLRVYQASTSEIFGATTESPQDEQSPFVPRNPYAVAKLYGHLMVASYRERYGLHASSGILYNHESPRRPLEFVTRKVTHAAAAIKLGLQTCGWAARTRRATGATRATPSRRCGSCSSRTRAGTTSCAAGRSGPCASSWRRRSRSSASTRGRTSSSTPRSYGRRTRFRSSEIPPERVRSSAGGRGRASRR